MLMVHGESDTEADHCGKTHGSVAVFSIDRDKCRIEVALTKYMPYLVSLIMDGGQ